MEFDTSTSFNSNGEIEGISPCKPSGLIVNATASKSILRNNMQPTQRSVPRSSEMLSGAPAQMLANQQMRIVRPDGKTHGYMTLHASIVLLNYWRCDTLIPDDLTPHNIHYKVNLSQTIGFVMVEPTVVSKVVI